MIFSIDQKIKERYGTYCQGKENWARVCVSLTKVYCRYINMFEELKEIILKKLKGKLV